MDYRYNYRFLSSWMKENNITRKHVLNAIGTQDFNSINAWVEGRRTLPLGILLRVCNTFQIPLEQFFFDNDATPAQPIRQPQSGDQTQPEGGYPDDHKRGNRQSIDPEPRFTEHTRMPREYPLPIAPDDTDNTTGDNQNINPLNDTSANETSTGDTPLLTDSIEILKLKIDHQKEINALQRNAREHEDSVRIELTHRIDKLRERLYHIIDGQSQTIERLTTLLHRPDNQSYHYTDADGIAAEERPQKKSM